MSNSQDNEKDSVKTAVNEGLSKIDGSAASATVIHSDLRVAGEAGEFNEQITRIQTPRRDDANSLAEEIRYGVPDGPRQKRREKYDGREPLAYAGHEAVAQFLATPKSHREFKSLTALAKHFNVTRMTVHRWKQNLDVMQRAYSLSMRNQIAGDLVARRDWQQIMEKAVHMAKSGDMQAMRFCESRAWPELRVEKSQISPGVYFEDLLGTSESDEEEELQDDRRQVRESDRCGRE